MPHKHRSIVLSYLTGLLGFFNTILVTLIAFPIVAKSVDLAAFGVFSIVTATVAAAMLAQNGLDTAFSLQLTVSIAGEDWPRAVRLVRQSRIINGFLAGMLTLVFCVGSAWYMWQGKSPSHVTIGQMTALVLCVAGNQIALCLLRTDLTALNATQKVWLTNLVRLGCNLFGSVMAISLAWSGAGILALASGELLASVATLIIIRVVASRECPWMTQNVNLPWSGFRQTAIFGFSMSLIMVSQTLESACEPWLFQFYLCNGLVWAGTFLLWMRLPLILSSFANLLSGNSVSTVQAAYTVDPYSGRRLFTDVLSLVGWISSLVAFGLTVWLVPVMRTWMRGAAETANGLNIAAFIAAIVSIKCLNTALGSLLVFSNRQTSVVAISIAQLIIKLVLASILLQTVSNPILGMCIASLAAALLAYCWTAAICVLLGEIRIGPVLGPIFGIATTVIVGRLLSPWFDQETFFVNGVWIGLAAVIGGIPIGFRLLTMLRQQPSPAHGTS